MYSEVQVEQVWTCPGEGSDTMRSRAAENGALYGEGGWGRMSALYMGDPPCEQTDW